MRKLILLIIVIAFFSSCSDEPSIEGVWRLSYEIKNGKNSRLVYHSRLIEFTEDSLKIVTFELNTGRGFAEIDSLELKYSRIGNAFTIHDEVDGDIKMNLMVSQDSLIWSFFDTTVRKGKYVFKKLIPWVSQEVTADFFIGKSFTIDNEFYHDSIHFKSEHSAIQTGMYGLNSPELNWGLVSYDGYDFLMLNLPFWNLIRLNVLESGEIILGDSPKAKNVLIMREAFSDLDKEKLFGDWVELVSSKGYPEMPKSDIRNNRVPVNLQVTGDSIRINHRKMLVTKAWNLTADGKRIYFENKMFGKSINWWFQNSTWKIININEQYITLNVYTGSLEGMGGDTVVLMKIKPSM